jgi:hypothetical protein
MISVWLVFKATREWLVFPFFTSFYGSDGTTFSKNLDDKQADHQRKPFHAQPVQKISVL